MVDVVVHNNIANVDESPTIHNGERQYAILQKFSATEHKILILYVIVYPIHIGL